MGDATGAVWVEKYRPQSLKDMAGQEGIIPLLSAYAAKKSLPHLLFAGPPVPGRRPRRWRWPGTSSVPSGARTSSS